MNKMKVEVEIEVPENMSKYEKYGFVRGAMSKAEKQLAEEKCHGEINLTSASGSWSLEEVEDEEDKME